MVLYIINRLSLFSFLIFYITANFAQQPTQEWVARWPTPESTSPAMGKSIKQDANGFIYVLADTGLGFGFLKYDQNGTLLFSVHHTAPGNWSSGSSLYFDVSPSGDVYITGHVYIEIIHWIYTVKFNQGGVFQWGKLYNPDVENTAEDIIVDNNGNIIVAGSSYDGSASFALLIKYSPMGDTLWTKYHNNQNRSGIRDIVIDNSNNIYAVGSGLQLPGRALIWKYNSSGNLIWDQNFTLDILRANIGHKINIDNSGNVYIIGTQVRPQTQYDTYVLKLGNNGDTVWSRNYQGYGPGNPSLWGPVISLDRSNIYYTGSYFAQSGGSYDIKTLKYDSLGNLQWANVFAGDPGGLDLPRNIKLDSLENVYVCGQAHYQSTGTDFIVLKYLPLGTLHWTIRYTGLVTNGGDYARDVLLHQSHIYATGFSRKTVNTEPDAVTLKYDQVLGINYVSNESPSNFLLSQNYPNPFNSTTIISYSLPVESYVELQIYNSLGQHVKDLVNNVQEASNYSIAVNFETYPSGVYFCKFTADNNYSKKLKLLYVK